MRRAILYPFVVLFAALLLVKAVENRDFKVSKFNRELDKTLSKLYPVNIVKEFTKLRSNGTSQAGGTKCSEQLTLLQEGLRERSMWALQMIDASSKIPSGILIGNRMDLGMFDECIEINVKESGHEILGRHCMYTAVITFEDLSLSQKLSICLPASCEAEDVQDIVEDALQLVEEYIPIAFQEATCTAIDPPKWTAGGIVTLVGFSMLLLFLVVCTISDIFMRYWNKIELRNGSLDMLRQFSLYSNAVRVLSTKTSPETLPALQGLRFFSMCWVIVGHTHMVAFDQTSINVLEIYQWVSTWKSLYILLAPFCVDSFFAMSGFLMSYVFLKEMATGRSFNLFGYYFHRYLRLTPALVALLLITIFVSPRIGSGALWESGANSHEQACRSGWWTMLLYLHNYVKTEPQGCLGHTWYLAVEMQFFWISPLILYPLAKKPKVGLSILAAFFIASVVIPVKIGYDNKFSTVMTANGQFVGDFGDNFMDHFYYVSHVRAAPWLIGIFFGYLIFIQKGSPARKATKWIGWLLATAAFSFCIFSMRCFQDENYRYDDVWESIYTALARPLWGFAISWVIYACVRGFGGAVSTFLSFSIYTPLCRISYCVYLVHLQLQFIKARAARTLDYFTGFSAFDDFLSDLLLSFMVGFAFTLLFESPVLVLEKIIKKRRGRRNDILKEKEGKKAIDNSGIPST